MKARILIALGLACLPAMAFGDVLYSSNLDDATGWTVNGTADTAYQFGWDFTSMGIPASPGGSTTGLRMAANIVDPTGAETVMATPTDFTVSGQYVVEFDFWINVNGPLPGGGGGSTEFGGGGVGYDGATAGLNGGSLIATGEGGSSRDWRLYKDASEQFYASGQYDTPESNNNWDPALSAQFPPQAPPQYQIDNYPQQTGSINQGCAGFAWHHMVITVDTDAIGSGVTQDPGIANFTVDGLSIGTIDNSNGGDVIAMGGNISLIYADLFSSVSDNADLSFGVFDNLVVTPEPASLSLLALGALALLRRR